MKENVEFTRKLVELNDSKKYTLSIRVTSDGFCFCILHQRKKKIIFYRDVQFESQEEFQQLLHDEPVFTYPIEKVVITYGGEHYTLLPVELFSQQKRDDFFVFNQPYQTTEIIAHDEIVSVNIVNIYSIPAYILQALSSKFPQALIIHQLSLYIDHVTERSVKTNDKQVYIDVDRNFFYACVVEQGALLLSNSYTYANTDELVYHIVNLYESMELNQQKTSLNISGILNKKSDEINMLKSYIKNIESVKYTNVSLASQMKDVETHNLLNLLISCEL